MTAPSGEPRTKIYIRPSSQDLGEMPIDSDVAIRARAGLSPRELGVWFSLNLHLWTYGELPAGRRRLAAIGGVTARAFEGMVPALAPLFDHDAYDRWGDADLVEKRRLQLNLEPDEHISFELDATPALEERDAILSEKRRQAGLRGARNRWSGARRARLHLLDGGRQSDAEPNILPSDLIANLPSENGKQPMANSDVLLSSCHGEPSCTYGSIDRTESLQPKEKIEESSARTNAPQASASVAGDGKTDGKKATGDNGKTPKGSHGKQADVHSKKDTHSSPSVSSPPQSPSDTTIIAALKEAGGGKIQGHVVAASSLAPIRELMSLGCDFSRDILPAFRDGVRGLREPLRTLQAGFIHKGAMENLAEARRAESAAAADNGKVFIERDSPEWQAWLKRLNRSSFPVFEKVVDGVRRVGWKFDKQWPTGVGPGP